MSIFSTAVELRYNEVEKRLRKCACSGTEVTPLNRFEEKRSKSSLHRGFTYNYLALNLNSVTLHYSAFSLIVQLLSGFQRLNNIHDLNCVFMHVFLLICFAFDFSRAMEFIR